MPRFAGGRIAATVLRPARSGTPTTQYSGLLMQIDPVSPLIPGQGDGRPFFQSMAYTFTCVDTSGNPLDIRVGDIIQDPSSTDPVSGQTTAWIVRWDNGRYRNHLELGVTLSTAVGG